MPATFLSYVAVAGMKVNVLLMALNLFPLLPLDGGRILEGMLPNALSRKYAKLEPYGMFILIFLIFSHALDYFVLPLAHFSLKAVYSLIGLS